MAEATNSRKEQSAATRRKLLDSAAVLFSENGYKGTSVRSLSRSIDMADGLLYHYFPGGKKEIFRNIVSENFAGITASINELRTEAGIKDMPLEAVLEYAFDRLSDIFSGHIDVIRIIIKEKEVHELVEREQTFEMLQSCQVWFEQLLRERAEKGEIGQIDFEAAAFSIKAMLMHGVFALVHGMGCSELEISENRRRMICYQVELWRNYKRL